MSGKPEKAAIYNVDKPGNPPVVCLFNPKEYSSTKQNQWQDKTAKGENVPHIEFGGGQPATLQMQLFFDTYATGEDVRQKHTDAIWELMLVDESLKDAKSKKSRPPMVRFQWGKAWYFEAVITNISQKFTLFLGDGTPVRATLDVTFRQIKDTKRFGRQNPTSGGEENQRQWEVKAGDTLAWIAYAEYGDSNEWRRIADANRMNNLRQLRPGQMLEIPNA
jgi:nucleoid-associated protein YgaU